MQNDSRNFLVLILVMGALLIAYQTFVVGPVEKRHQAEQQAAAAQTASQKKSGLAPNGQVAAPTLTRAQAEAASPRVQIATPHLTGSISLQGARLDDLFLCGPHPAPGDPACYHQTTDKASPPVELLTPLGAENAYFATNGWYGTNLPGMPNETTLWTQVSQGPLTEKTPLELTYASPGGLVFHREIKVDDRYLFTITDTVQNTGTAAVNIAPYGSVQRRGVPPTLGKTAMEGAIGMFNSVLKEYHYQQWKKDGSYPFTSTGGWLGVTDKYWMTVFAPAQQEPLTVQFRVTQVQGVDDYETDYNGAPRVIAPGASTTETTHLFAGAKTVPMLKTYGAQLGLPRFEDAVDWGWFSVLTKPLFMLVELLKGWVGTFALAILALTVIIRTVLFPLYGSSYEMSTKMKKVQPEMKVLQEKFKGDPQQLQKETMALYSREKINPITGCVPALLPIPVLIALTNLFNVTIEMRQAPFFGWIKDMSAPDPTTIWNLFGLIPWNPGLLPLVGGFLVGDGPLHIGAWAAIYAFTLWVSMSIAPPATGIDPTQQKIMQFMPLIFTFFLAHSAAGLVIYWSWSSVFTIVQQYIMMRRFNVENPIDGLFGRLTGRKQTT